jgi:hypothetical protein
MAMETAADIEAPVSSNMAGKSMKMHENPVSRIMQV